MITIMIHVLLQTSRLVSFAPLYRQSRRAMNRLQLLQTEITQFIGVTKHIAEEELLFSIVFRGTSGPVSIRGPLQDYDKNAIQKRFFNALAGTCVHSGRYPNEGYSQFVLILVDGNYPITVFVPTSFTENSPGYFSTINEPT